eukprot:m.19574 g.19574  ORF g.19574 m.19574 type:complete len:389 (+) comp8483_c0_seq2:44-1210(+)
MWLSSSWKLEFVSCYSQQWLVIVTGGTSGIGLSIVKELKNMGFLHVLVIGKDKEDLDDCFELDEELLCLENNSECLVEQTLFLKADLSTESGQKNALKVVGKALGEFEGGLLINNVGVSASGPKLFVDHDFHSEVSRILDINVSFTTKITHLFLNHCYSSQQRFLRDYDGKQCLDRRKWKGVVFVSSQSGLLPSPYCSVYGASKAFLVSLCENIQSEVADRNRRAKGGHGSLLEKCTHVNVVCSTPGLVSAGNTLNWFSRSRLTQFDVASRSNVAKGVLKALVRPHPQRLCVCQKGRVYYDNDRMKRWKMHSSLSRMVLWLLSMLVGGLQFLLSCLFNTRPWLSSPTLIHTLNAGVMLLFPRPLAEFVVSASLQPKQTNRNKAGEGNY